jgi:flagellar biosynthesis chaperone FliJ
MKKILAIITVFALWVSLGIGNSMAQEVIATTELSKKEQKAEVKLAKAKLDLEKSKSKLSKLKEAHTKKRQTFDKKNSQGKLSPNDIAKYTKALDKLGSKIDKEQKNIVKLEAFIRENDTM